MVNIWRLKDGREGCFSAIMESNPDGFCTSSSTNTQHPYNVESSATFKPILYKMGHPGNEEHNSQLKIKPFRLEKKEQYT